MIRVTGINLLTYINWICDDISQTGSLGLKEMQEDGEGAERGRDRRRKETRARKVQQTDNLPGEHDFIFQRPPPRPPHLRAAPDL